jgi:hypothetical protein
MDRNYGGVIWTNHAMQRLQERGIRQTEAWATWKSPEQSRYAKSRGAWIYYKTYGHTMIEVVAKQNEKKEWLILSVWSKPVFGKHHVQGKTQGKGFWAFIKSLITGK